SASAQHLLRSLPGVAKVEVLVATPSPTLRIIRIATSTWGRHQERRCPLPRRPRRILDVATPLSLYSPSTGAMTAPHPSGERTPRAVPADPTSRGADCHAADQRPGGLPLMPPEGEHSPGARGRAAMP